MNNELNIDLDHLTVGEIEQIEELTGLPIDAIGSPDKPKGKFMRAIGYVIKRRENPGFTWEDAANLVVRLGDEPAPPTSAGA